MFFVVRDEEVTKEKKGNWWLGDTNHIVEVNNNNTEHENKIRT